MDNILEDETYDGFMVAPDDEGNIDISFFDLKEEEYKGGNPIEGTIIGEKYHVILFKRSDDNEMNFEDSFEAIFRDPVYYAKSLLPKFYSMFLKKTDKSTEWFEDYLQGMLLEIIKQQKNVKEMAESIANN
jgi:hypothetical protein